MPVAYSNPIGFPSRIANWLTNACDNYSHADHWKKHDRVSSSVSRYAVCAGAHINRIPVEILGEIFIHCLTETTPTKTVSLPTSLSPSSQADPQSLGEVCRFWRDITLSTPSLWSKMEIYEPQRAQVQRVVMWLNRSRGYPLDITIIQLVRSVTLKDHAATDEILSLLIGQVHRWKRIYFRFTSTTQKSLLALPMGSPIALESACVDARRWEYKSADQLWKVLHSSPSLLHADWESYTKGLPVHVPWNQLTSIAIHHGLSVEECIDIVRGCQHLVALRIHAVWSYNSLVDPRGTLVLPRLRHLSFLGCIEATALFNRLTLPSLVSLKITNRYPHHYDEYRSFSSLRDLLHRSACRLEKFSLLNPDMGEDLLLEYLSIPQMLSLRELELDVPVTDRAMNHLTADNQNPHLCLPSLEAINIEDIRASDGQASHMILSRLANKSLPPLKGALLRIKAKAHPQDLATFQSIMKHNNWLHIFVT